MTCLMKISRRRLCPKGLYFRLKRSKRWKDSLPACMSRVSTFRSYLHAQASVDSVKPKCVSRPCSSPPVVHAVKVKTYGYWCCCQWKSNVVPNHALEEQAFIGRKACCPCCCAFAAWKAASGRGAGIPSEAEGFKDLQQGEVLAISEDDHLPRLLAQLALDEAQQVLLVHARAVMHMRIHLHACKSQLL